MLSIEGWLNIWVMLFGVGVLGFAPLYGFAAIVLLMTSLVLAICDRETIFLRPFLAQEKFFLSLVMLYFLAQTASVLFQPEGYEYESLGRQLAAFDPVSRWLLLIPLWLIFRAYRVDWVFIGLGLAIGSTIGALFAHYQVYHLGFPQAVGASNHPIPFAELMVAADMLLWIYMLRAWEMNRQTLSGIFFVTSLFAFYASLLAVTRGAWLAYVVMIGVWVWYTAARTTFDVRHLFSPLVVFRVSVAVFLFVLVSQTDHYQIMQSKTIATISGLQQGNLDAATSLRYTNFLIAWESIRLHPFGIGMDNYGQAEGALFGHAHNELLNTAVEAGIFGVLALIAMVLFSVYVFLVKASQSKNFGNDNVALNASCGLMLICSYVIFSQSQAVFSHHDTLLFFIFYLYLFFGQTCSVSRPMSENPNR